MDSLEEIHSRYSKDKLALGTSMLPNRRWNMSRDWLTQNYFHWDQLIKIK